MSVSGWWMEVYDDVSETDSPSRYASVGSPSWLEDYGKYIGKCYGYISDNEVWES